MSRRTTLTLDDDVADGLALEARRAGRPFRDVVNAALRRGLRTASDDPPFRVEAQDLGRHTGVQVDDVEGLLEVLDAPSRP